MCGPNLAADPCAPAAPTTRALCRASEGNWPRSLNKTESLSLTFEAIRTKRIQCYAWELAQEYLMDCLNLFRAPGERQSSGGSGTGGMAAAFLYRAHPSKPNDSLMAMNYCFMLGKILLREPMFADQTLRIRLEQTLQSNMNYIDSLGPGAFSG